MTNVLALLLSIIALYISADLFVDERYVLSTLTIGIFFVLFWWAT